MRYIPFLTALPAVTDGPSLTAFLIVLAVFLVAER